MEINKLAQYNRSPFMLELSGIPRQDDENVIDLASKTALSAGYVILMWVKLILLTEYQVKEQHL